MIPEEHEQSFRDYVRRGRQMYVAGTPEKYPLTKMSVLVLDAEAVLAKIDHLRAEVALDATIIKGYADRVGELEAEVARLEAALRHVIDDSPGTPQSVKQYLERALRGGGQEQT